MRIVFWIEYLWKPWRPEDIDLGLGSFETAVVSMATALCRLGHVVRVYAPFERETAYRGVSYLNTNRVKFYGDECDILVVARFAEGVDAPIHARAKILWATERYPTFNNELRLSKFDLVMVLSEWQRDECRGDIFHVDNPHPSSPLPHIDPKRIVVTRYGTDTGRFDNLLKQENRIIYTTSPDDGLETLLRLFPTVRKQVPNAELHVYCSSYDIWWKSDEYCKLEHFKTLCESVSGVTFHGRVDSKCLSEAFATAKVWALPSKARDTSCISALDAQAAGCIPVCSSGESWGGGCIGEIVKHGFKIHAFSHNGYDYAFSQSIVQMLTDEPARSKLANAARKHAVDYLDWNVIAKEWEVVFRTFRSGRRVSRVAFPMYMEPPAEEVDIENVIVILTCKRPHAIKYLPSTIESVMKEGGRAATKRVIVCDGPWDESMAGGLLDGWDVVSTGDERLGSTQATWHAFKHADDLKARKMLFIEDDVVFCKNGVTRALSLSVPEDMGFITGFCAYHPFQMDKNTSFGLHKRDACWFVYNQCLIVPRRSIHLVAMADPLIGSWGPNLSDVLLNRLFARSPWKYVGVHVPNLVDHKGEVSSIFSWESLNHRRSLTFQGEDFDALTLDF